MKGRNFDPDGITYEKAKDYVRKKELNVKRNFMKRSFFFPLTDWNFSGCEEASILVSNDSGASDRVAQRGTQHRGGCKQMRANASNLEQGNRALATGF